MANLEEHRDEFTTIESHVYKQIQAFKQGRDSWGEKLKKGADDKLQDAIEKLQESSSGETAQKGIDAVLQVLNDTSSWSLRPEKIWENFHDEGLSVSSLDDVQTLELEAIERVVDNLDTKYNTMAFAEGTAAGAAGLPGALAGLPAIVGLCLRAINEYAISFGFDVDDPDERAMVVLTLAASASTGDKRVEMFDRIEEHARSAHSARGHRGEIPDPIMNEVAQELVVRLVRGSLAQALPLVGALVGGSFDRAFVKNVCETARRVYEDRWLLRRYEFGQQDGASS